MTAVAVIGGGAAGLGAARTLLRAGCEVTLIEAGPRLGGNCVGLPVRGTDGRQYAIDVGVSDFNRVTFEEVTALFDDLGLESRPIVQDAHFGSPAGRTKWACTGGQWTFRDELRGADRVLEEADAFRTRALEVLDDDRFAACTFGEYLDHIDASRALREALLYPRAMGSFPSANGCPSELHARSVVRFWNVHGIVSDRPSDRRAVVGGMHRYVTAYAAWFEANGGELLCGTRLRGTWRRRTGVTLDLVRDGERFRRRFDHVVVTAHPADVAPSISDASDELRRVLSAFVFQRARVVVHQDPRVMGDRRDLWGAYNYVVPEGPLPRVRPTITFFPNRLASLPKEVPDTFVTMNPHVEPNADSVLASRSFLHPVGCMANEHATRRLEANQGHRRTWFAGAYLRAPFVHESAYSSGTSAAQRLLSDVASPTKVLLGPAQATAA